MNTPLLGALPTRNEVSLWCRSKGLAISAVIFLGAWLLVSQVSEKDQPAVLQASGSPFMDMLLDLDQRMDGRVILPNDQDFPDARSVWNQICMLQPPPRAVIEVASELDVQMAMQLLVTLNVSFSIRSGGHSKAGYSNAPDGIVISLKRLNQIQVTVSADGDAFAKLGPGIKGPEILAATLPMGYAAVLGQCSSVAEGGFVLGGGWGIMSRQHGLGLDNLLSARVVLASAALVEANSTHYADLFWALRGAGIGNFGVVTEMTYQLHPAQKSLVCGWHLIIPAAQAAEFLQRIAAREFPRQMHLLLETVGHPMSFSVLWQCPEPSCLESGRAFLKNEVASLVNDAHLKIYPCTWFDNTYGSNNTMLVQSYTGFLKPINATADIIQKIIDTLYEWAISLGSTYVMPDMELWGGRISDISSDATASPHRDAVYNVGVVVEVPQDQPKLFGDIVGRLNQEWHRVGKYLDGAYVNYQMASLRQEEYAQVYWGHNVRSL